MSVAREEAQGLSPTHLRQEGAEKPAEQRTLPREASGAGGKGRRWAKRAAEGEGEGGGITPAYFLNP